MSENITNTLMCPICGNKLDYTEEFALCPECGYSDHPIKAAIASEPDKYRRDAASYRLMTTADTYFSRKNYDEAYISYKLVLNSDPHCLKAVFRRDLVSQYLMLETSSVYLRCETYFRKTMEMLTFSLESNIEDKLVLTMCRDMLDFILFSADYEQEHAVSLKNRQELSEYMSHILELLDYTRFIMNCIISVNSRDSAFAAMKCFDAGAELHKRILAGIDCPGLSEEGGLKKVMAGRSETNRAKKLYSELAEIKQNILQNADDILYGELKALEKKDSNEKNNSEPTENFQQAEYESWRKQNIRKYVSADKRNIIFGIISKIAFVFALVLAAIFITEAVIYDEVIGGMALSAVLLAAVGAVSVSLEKNFESKRKFYAKLVHTNNDHRRQ